MRYIIMNKLQIAFVFFVILNSTAFAAENETTLNGISMETKGSGQPESILFFSDVTLSDEENDLTLPALFEGDIATNNLEIFFNEIKITLLVGLEGVDSDFGFLLVDVSAQKGQTGDLKIVLTNSGEQSSELFLVQNIDALGGLGESSDSGGGGGGAVSPYFLALFCLLFLVRALGTFPPRKT